MYKTLALGLIILLAAGCAGERGRTTYYPAAYPPPPPSTQPPPSYRQTPPAHVATGPRPVKPLGQGMLASNAVEGYMDTQESELRAQLRGSGVIVARTGNALLLNIRNDQLFEPNTTAISSRGGEILERIATTVRKFDSSLIVVNAYTDTTGTHEQNLAVSQKRADAVVRQFSEDGVEQKRLAGKGFGDEILKIPTGPNVSEPRNRRIEMRITPVVKT